MIKLTTEQIAAIRSGERMRNGPFGAKRIGDVTLCEREIRTLLRLAVCVVGSGVDVRGLRDGEASCMAMREAIAAEMERAR